MPGTDLVSIEEFYQRYNIQDTHPFDLIAAVNGILSIREPTVTIQLFIYPDAWPTHLSWAALLLYLIGRGAGALSLDKLFKMD